MTSVIAIEQRIKELDGGAYQRLVQAFLASIYRPRDFSYPGSQAGSNKVTKGRPDAQYLTPEGGYVFLEAGSITDHGKAVVKMKDDLQDTLDFIASLNAAGDERRVDKIVLAYTCSMISALELHDISGGDERVKFLSINELAEKLRRHPYLLKEHLGFESGNQQLMDYEGFVDRCARDRFSPSQSSALIGREDELTELLELMSEGWTVLLTGPSGSGKTRLALEVLRQIELQGGATVCYCASDGEPYVPDLAEYIDGSQRSLLFLDDVNAFIRQKSLVDFLLDHQSVGVMATVRDYELPSVQREFDRLPKMRVYQLGHLDEEAFEACVCEANDRYTQDLARDLWSVTHKNLRLALTCVKNLNLDEFPKKGFGMSDLISRAYSKVLEILEANEVTALEILSLLQRGWLSDPSVGTLKKRYGLTDEEFDGALRSLYGHELVQTVGPTDGMAFFVIEQNLRDYFIYLQLVKEHSVSLCDLADMGVGVRHLRTLAVSVCSVFPSREVRESIQRQVVEVWNKHSESRDELLRRCAFLLPDDEKVLAVKERVESALVTDGENAGMPLESTIDLLCDVLRQEAESPRLAWPLIDWLCELVCRRGSVATGVTQLIKDKFGYQVISSHRNVDTGSATLMLERLAAQITNDPCQPLGELLCRHAANLLGSRIEAARIDEESGTATFYSGTLGYSDMVMGLRERAIAEVARLLEDDDLNGMAKDCLLGVDCWVDEDSERARLELMTIRTCFETYVHGVDPDEYDVNRLTHLHETLRAHGVLPEMPDCLAEIMSDVERAIDLGKSHGDKKPAAELMAWAQSVPVGRVERVIEGLVSAGDCRRLASVDYEVASGVARIICAKSLYAPDDAEAILEYYLRSGGPHEHEFSTELASLVESKGWQYVRGLVGEAGPSLAHRNNRGYWLRAVDTCAVHNGWGAQVADQLLVSAKEEGESLHFSLLREVDGRVPGFYRKYLEALFDGDCSDAASLAEALPQRDDDGRSLLLAALDEDAELLPKLESAATRALAEDAGGLWADVILQVCLDVDPAYAATLARRLCSRGLDYRLGEFDSVASALWESGSAPECVRTAMLEAMTMESGDLLSQCHSVDLCKAIANAEPEDVRGGWLLSFLAENAFDRNKKGEQCLNRCCAAAASQLPAELRSDYILRLCREGLEPENLHGSVTDPSGADGWSGSEADHVETKIRFWRELADQFDVVEHAEMRKAIREIIDNLAVKKTWAAARDMAYGA